MASTASQESPPTKEARNKSSPLPNTRRGNYILTFGMPRAGKTTFQNFLIRYLVEGSDASFALDPLPIDGQPESMLLLKEWRKQWQNGELATPTEVGQPKEFGFRVTPIGPYKGKAELEFGFFEVSGEDLKTVLVERKSGTIVKQSLPRDLEHFLVNRNIRFILVLVCDGDDPSRDDELFSDFLEYLGQIHGKYSRQFRQGTPVLILVSKPRLTLTKITPLADVNGATQAVQAVKTFLPLTHGSLVRWGADVQAALLDIGKIEPIALPTEKQAKDRLVEPNYEHIGHIFKWIYEHFTGTPLGPTFMQRLWHYFVSLFGA